MGIFWVIFSRKETSSIRTYWTLSILVDVWRPFPWSGNFQMSTRSMWSFQVQTGMNYMGMVTGNKWRGSGFSEILIEAELVTTGCLSGVLKGKAYVKALFCLKTVSEAMQRSLFERFTEEENVEVFNPMALLNIVQICNRENLNLALLGPLLSSVHFCEAWVHVSCGEDTWHRHILYPPTQCSLHSQPTWILYLENIVKL